jgi:hypothetical protein
LAVSFVACEAQTVWTPKRVLLLAAGFVLLFGAYEVYAHFLPIDGLPQLPDIYLPPQGDGIETIEIIRDPRPDAVVTKLRQAFGEFCKEATNKYPIKLELRGRNMILATSDFNFEHDPEGRVRLSPVSVAMFSKAEPGKFPEINTVRAEVAYLTFDKPIKSMTELSTRKITKGELRGKIEIVHNRRTPQPDDDIVIQIDDGPLYYVENEHRLWTEKWVTLNDSLDAPQNTKVSAEGMDLYLHTKQETVPNTQSPSRKPKNDAVSGVDRVILRSAVTMNLWVDRRSGLMSAGQADASIKDKGTDKPSAAADAGSGEPEPKDKVIITTPGPFNYDMVKNFAQFDIPPVDPHRPSRYPERVQVERCHEITPQENDGKNIPLHRSRSQISGVFAATASGPLGLASALQIPSESPEFLRDQMDCEHLELQFRRKTPAAAATTKNAAKQPPTDDRAANLEIETVHATGKKVVLVSEPDELTAWVTDFFYNAQTHQTTLKGDPKINPVHVNNKTFGMWILKEGNEIYANELELMNQKGSQSALARGPGCIRLLDKTTGNRPLQASWNDSFSWLPDGKLEIMTLVGNGVFYDDEHAQYLQGDNLKVWLQPADVKPAANGSQPPVQNSRKPKKVEATGHVLAKSPDMKVHNTESLLVHFKDTPAEKGDSGKTAATKKTEPMVGISVPGTVGGKAPTPAGPPNAPAKPANPIDLSAESVEVTVLRGGEKNELDELRCFKDVHVIQAPATPEEKGVDIVGDKLHLKHFPEGNQLVVTGDLAQLRLDKIFIVGPVVNIDQAANKAYVNGIGAMQMESQSDFQGNPLKKPVPLTIHWNKSMMFNGPDAEFHGGIQATQENAHLMCQVLQVYFDKPVNLKEGNKGGDAAKVKHLVCDQKVSLHDVTYEDKRVVKDQFIACNELAVDNEANRALAKGPNGIVRLYQPGAADSGPTGTPVGRADPKGGEKPAEEMKLTYVTYNGVMWTDNNQRVAKFSDQVKLLNLPTKNPNLAVNLDKLVDSLPADGLYLEADNLVVSDKPENGEGDKVKDTKPKDKNAKEKSNQEMEATGHVFVKAQDFYGRAWRVTYVENKDQVIFYGGDKGASAYLYRVTVKGRDPDVIEANKIIYLRKTGEFSVDGGKTFKGRN